MTKIPSDNHIRAMLDPASPSLLYPVFADVLKELETANGLSAFHRLGKHVLFALDGTEYFCSKKLHCPHCSHRERSDVMAKQNTSIRCSARRWWRLDTIM
jgi:hypothetical protein